MDFKKHSELEDQHAFLSPSKYSWLNYDEEKLSTAYFNFLATQKGSELHDFAARCISLGIELPKKKKTLNMYINDAIGYRMTPEQPLCYSLNCFGTADAISFRRKLLRIHDLKTGTTKASMRQLEVYAALFCLEYNVNPSNINTELRIYQANNVVIQRPDPYYISEVMDTIVRFDKLIEKIKSKG